MEFSGSISFGIERFVSELEKTKSRDIESEEDVDDDDKESTTTTEDMKTAIKSQFGNFSILSLLARKDTEKEKLSLGENCSPNGRNLSSNGENSAVVEIPTGGGENSLVETSGHLTQNSRSLFPFLFPPLRDLFPPIPLSERFHLDATRHPYLPPAYSSLGKGPQLPLMQPFSLRGFPSHSSLFRQVDIFIRVETGSFMLFYFRQVRLRRIHVLSVTKYFTRLMV